MALLEQIQRTGIYPNEATHCYEAWIVRPETGEKALVATCSMGVPDDQYQWWVHQVWNRWMPAWGVRRAGMPHAA